jgi:hypothetical protein
MKKKNAQVFAFFFNQKPLSKPAIGKKKKKRERKR